MILFAEVVLFTCQLQKGWSGTKGANSRQLFFVRTYKTLGMPDSMNGDCWRHLSDDIW